MLGTGKYYVFVENCLEALPNKRAHEVNLLIDNYPLKDYTFEYQLFQCDNCTFLFDHRYLQVNFKNQMTYLSKIQCPACQKNMSQKNIFVDRIHELTCPICQYGGEMSLTGEMDWD